MRLGAIALLVAAAPVFGLFLVEHDLDAQHTVGLQSRADRRRHSANATEHDEAQRCAAKASPHATHACDETDPLHRDQYFYRSLSTKSAPKKK